MAEKKPAVAFIGTGIMGAPIAGHIMDAGYPLTIFTRTRNERAEALIERGAVWADTPADAAREADIVFTMLGYPTDVEEVYLSSDGLLAAAKRGATLIDLTTSSPELARDIAEAAEVSGLYAFDCPVTGGERGAIDGTLTLIVGATERDIEPIRSLLETFGKHIFCFGGPGAGQTAKLSNQVALAGCLTGMADALSLAQQSGLDLARVRELIVSGTGRSGVMETLAPAALDGDYRPGFKVTHFLKDLGLALQLAEDREIVLPGAETAFGLYDVLDTIGGGEMGTQALTLMYQEEADAVAAGLDWSQYTMSEDSEGCGCGHDHEHAHEHGEGCCHGHDGSHDHEHGEGCCHGHDGSHDHEHEHGESCCHTHGEGHTHEHGEGCCHKHEGAEA
ncbi:NAD-binding protein [Collinsella sp. AGMB00827]|uniref:NAD-binding protein n=1 Tax=Collinsella ureilytica TaxID=2869515 RepID=A0ABS7MJP6_9ACTN|nr:NAD(P)-binding domain-containing protein [Collinsella urealyticum]MBY4797482.1 NAD-binding protein [Collinsella urealyticum]